MVILISRHNSELESEELIAAAAEIEAGVERTGRGGDSGGSGGAASGSAPSTSASVPWAGFATRNDPMYGPSAVEILEKVGE